MSEPATPAPGRTAADLAERLLAGDKRALARAISLVENDDPEGWELVREVYPHTGRAAIVGLTGAPGAGKSTLIGALTKLRREQDRQVAVLSIDPSSPFTQGALLGDRIRMNSLYGEHADRAYMRSFATRQAHRATSESLREAVDVARAAGFDVVVVETAGIGQSDTEIAGLADVALYVMTAEYGAPSQLEKIGMLDTADLVALNKFEKRGSEDALRDVRKYLRKELGLPATRFKVVGYWTPITAWDEKFAALPASVQQELDAIWSAVEDAEPEDVQIRFEEQLDRLGL